MPSIGLRVFVIGVELWYYLQTHWFSGSFRLQAMGGVLLVYWVLGCLVALTQDKSKGPNDPVLSPAG